MAIPLMKQAPDGQELLSWSITYRPGQVTSRAARDSVRAFLARLERSAQVGLAERTLHDVQLVVSELVTNACRYAPGPCRLQLESTRDAVRVSVWDTGSSIPVRRNPDLVRGGGHGLSIVSALCRSVTMERQAGGKRIIAEIELR